MIIQLRYEVDDASLSHDTDCMCICITMCIFDGSILQINVINVNSIKNETMQSLKDENSDLNKHTEESDSRVESDLISFCCSDQIHVISTDEFCKRNLILQTDRRNCTKVCEDVTSYTYANELDTSINILPYAFGYFCLQELLILLHGNLTELIKVLNRLCVNDGRQFKAIRDSKSNKHSEESDFLQFFNLVLHIPLKSRKENFTSSLAYLTEDTSVMFKSQTLDLGRYLNRSRKFGIEDLSKYMFKWSLHTKGYGKKMVEDMDGLMFYLMSALPFCPDAVVEHLGYCRPVNIENMKKMRFNSVGNIDLLTDAIKHIIHVYGYFQKDFCELDVITMPIYSQNRFELAMEIFSSKLEGIVHSYWHTLCNSKQIGYEKMNLDYRSMRTSDASDVEINVCSDTETKEREIGFCEEKEKLKKYKLSVKGFEKCDKMLASVDGQKTDNIQIDFQQIISDQLSSLNVDTTRSRTEDPTDSSLFMKDCSENKLFHIQHGSSPSKNCDDISTCEGSCLSSDYKHVMSSDWLFQDQVLNLYPSMVEPIQDMENHLYRIATFRVWPLDAPVSALKLVDAGFFMSQDCQAIQCFSCGLKIQLHELTDLLKSLTVLQLHILYCPSCEYAQEKVKVKDATDGDLTSSINRLHINQSTECQEVEGQPSKWLSIGDQTSIFRKTNISDPEDHFLMPYTSYTEELDISKFSSSASNETLTQPSVQDSAISVGSVQDSSQYISPEMAASSGDRKMPSVPNTFDMSSSNFPSAVGCSTIDASITQSKELNEEFPMDYIGIKHPRYSNISDRLKTFISWPKPEIQDPKVLTDAGYFYTNKNDTVRCFYCDIGLAEWDDVDNPWVEHARHSPGCQYLITRRGKRFIREVQEEWGQIYVPKSPFYESELERLNSFKNWPESIRQRPPELVAAGFYFTDEGDIVRCFYCDGGLQMWDPEDDPWKEHAKWFPFCKYVARTKGMDYIQTVARTYDDNECSGNTASSVSQYPVTDSDYYSGMREFDGSSSRSLESGAPSQFAATQILLDMGYTSYAVRYIVNTFIKETGKTSFTAEDLMTKVLEMGERNEEIPSQSPGVSYNTDFDDGGYTQASNMNPEDVKKENEKLKEKIFCGVCKKNQRDIIFIPCGHRFVCEQCSGSTKKCNVCHKKVKKKVKTFLC